MNVKNRNKGELKEKKKLGLIDRKKTFGFEQGLLTMDKRDKIGLMDGQTKK